MVVRWILYGDERCACVELIGCCRSWRHHVTRGSPVGMLCSWPHGCPSLTAKRSLDYPFLSCPYYLIILGGSICVCRCYGALARCSALSLGVVLWANHYYMSHGCCTWGSYGDSGPLRTSHQPHYTTGGCASVVWLWLWRFCGLCALYTTGGICGLR